MYDLTGLRNWLVYQLYQHTDTPMVPQNSPDSRPPKPFNTYNFISPYIRQPAQPAMTTKEEIVNGESWIRYERWELPTLTISFNSYSNDITECWQKAMEIREYFALQGYRDLKKEEVIVASIESMEDRTLLLDETSYEFRVGFDVILRVVSETSKLIETIEEVQYKE